MRRILLTVTCLLTIPYFAHAQVGASERIVDFAVVMDVQMNRSLSVVETIRYDFGSTPKHGIYRDLPVQYANRGAQYNVRYTLGAVTDGAGSPLQTNETRTGSMLRIRIGDPDRTVTGEQTYVVRYSVQRALPTFDGRDEVYWNVTGNGWNVPIAATSFVLRLPERQQPDSYACYTGRAGSTAQNCTAHVNPNGEIVFTASGLAAGEGLTVAAQLPGGLVVAETSTTRVRYFFQDNWLVVLPLLAFIVMHWQWRTRGRDPKGRGTVIPQYEPPRGLPPAVIGAVPDNTVGAREFSATILHLASRGYLKIRDLGKAGLIGSKRNYEFTRVREASANLQAFERTLLDGLFSSGTTVTTQLLKYKFAATYQKVVAEARTQLVERGVYARDPRTVQAVSIILGLLGVGAFLAVSILQQGTLFFISFLGAFTSAIIVVVYGLLMPARTKLGAEILEEVRGFQWFLSVTETERLKFHNAPAKKPEQFMDFLPHAVALGVERQWAEQFRDLAIPQPDWYRGNLTTFNALVFANAMSNMSSDVHSSLAAVPRSSGSGGGGFSGGGFGGGGGGSW